MAAALIARRLTSGIAWVALGGALCAGCAPDRVDAQIAEVFGDPDSRAVEVSIDACNRDPEVQVVESDEEVKLHVTVDEAGSSVDDCMGGADVTLEEPLGDRRVVVNGQPFAVTPTDGP